MTLQRRLERLERGKPSSCVCADNRITDDMSAEDACKAYMQQVRCTAHTRPVIDKKMTQAEAEAMYRKMETDLLSIR